MDDDFKIFVEQLRNGHERKIEEVLDPEFLDIHEKDLSFRKKVYLKGKAYLAEDELILHWDAQTEAEISCSICNEPVSIGIQIQDFYHAEPLSEIKTGIFNFKDLLRETILLEVPPFAECHQGKCPKRKEIKKYLKDPSKKGLDEERYHPFADLDLE
jgi:uncharacterized metal-binding protein YceD (DUF177 family)